MLFVLWFKFDPDHTGRVRELWKRFTYPDDVEVIGRYVLIGRHMSVAIFDAPTRRRGARSLGRSAATVLHTSRRYADR